MEIFENFEDTNFQKLVKERLEWEAKHKKPWYLVSSKKLKISLNIKRNKL